jgi:SAM-dependent methyltransferase
MRILNLGCGTKVSSSPEVINIDWSAYLRLKKSRALRVIAPLFLKGQRLNRFRSLSDNIVVHNLAKGLPFASNSVDVVYHSHLLEHLDRDKARIFLLETKRVLRPGGIQRIVVPDLEKAARAYLSHLSSCQSDPAEPSKHDFYVAAMIEQCVRKQACSASEQGPFRRLIENTLLGDARRRGETHQWMYDRINLSILLVSLGYSNVQVRSYGESLVPNWNQYGLDLDSVGKEYKPDSLYMESQK